MREDLWRPLPSIWCSLLVVARCYISPYILSIRVQRPMMRYSTWLGRNTHAFLDQKTINLLLVAFHAMMSTFTAASIIPAFVQLAARFDCTIAKASYLASLQIAVLGGAPLFWRPLSNRFGRRPIWLISTIGSLVCNIGCAKSPTYGSMAACRALVAFFISPAAALGSAIVSETFFKHERARYMGIWTVMVTLGVPLGSFIFGFVIYHIGYTWVYWILAMVSEFIFHDAHGYLYCTRSTADNSSYTYSSAPKLVTSAVASNTKVATSNKNT